MKKVLIFLILLSLVIPCAAAADYDGMTVLHRAWYVDGTEYVIAANASGEPYYYVDGVLAKGAGLVFVDGYYYYVRTNGNCPYDRGYSIATSNDLLPVAYYYFDSYGRMIDPPLMPDGWEEVWFDYDPTLVEPTDPTDPTEPSEDPNDPDALPSVPPPNPPVPPDNSLSIINFVTQAFLVPGTWFMNILTGSGMVGLFLALFMIFQLIRILMAPIIGHAGSDTAKRSRDKEK